MTRLIRPSGQESPGREPSSPRHTQLRLVSPHSDPGGNIIQLLPTRRFYCVTSKDELPGPIAASGTEPAPCPESQFQPATPPPHGLRLVSNLSSTRSSTESPPDTDDPLAA